MAKMEKTEELVKKPEIQSDAPPTSVDIPSPTEAFDFDLNGVATRARQYIGIGMLNVETGRGEVKAMSGDFILDLSTTRVVIPCPTFELMAKNIGRKDIIPYDEFVARKVLNDKSGPDKFSPPLREGGENLVTQA